MTTEGAELYEFAVALPLLLVLVVGIIDFASAYNTKQIISNAARLAARTLSVTPLSVYDPNCGWNKSSPGNGTPCPVQGVATSVSNYLTDAGLSKAACLSTSSGTYTSPYQWTYSCNGVTLHVDKAQKVSNGALGAPVVSVEVTLSYPYSFSFGRVIGLLLPGATGPEGQVNLTSDAVMQNLVLN
ncbi:MAG TPA: TadE/TadG family type IV pilus assembly protein [Terriglobia bacterium]|nr:TadE/TadG family type IV pilus assembly protein [Terriglobia bacterium]